MKTFIIDTNSILRFYLNDIESQAEYVKEIFKKAKEEEIKLILPVQILFELDFVLNKVYKQDLYTRIELLSGLINTPYIGYENQEARNLIMDSLFIFSEGKISLVDSWLVNLARSRGADLLTFDKAMLKY